MQGAEYGVPAGRRRWTRHWQWPVLLLWVAGTVLIFGPITDATGSLNPPPVEGAVQDVISVGMLATIVLLLLLGRRLGSLLGGVSAAGGVGVGIADIPQVGNVGVAELVVFSILLGGSLWGWHAGGLAQARERADARALIGEGSVALRRYRFSKHYPRLQIDGSDLLISLPAYFGKAGWRIPVRDVAVSSPAVASFREDSSEAVLADVVRIPYLATTAPLTTPNLILLFRKPLRAPRLRWSYVINANPLFGSFRQRLRERATLDGVMLRCADPEEAVRTLAAGGAEITYRPQDWLAQHRQVVEDETERQKLLARADKSRRLARLSAAVSTAGFIVLGALRVGFLPRDTWTMAAGIGGVILASLIAGASRRRLRR